MYFKGFPSIYYQYDIGDETILKTVTDVTLNTRIRGLILENLDFFEYYDVQEGETPDIISYNVYGSSDYHWAIMLANSIFDVVTEFPMSSNVLNDYVLDKYNKFIATSWSYEVVDNVTYVNLTIPNHGISASEISQTLTNPLTIENAFVNANYYIDDELILSTKCLATGLDNATITAAGIIDANTLRITVTGPIEGAVKPDDTLDATAVITTSGKLTLATTNRDQLIHHYVLDGFVVNGTPTNIAAGAYGVTNAQYESDINESKRRIKIIAPQFINAITAEMQNLIK